MKQATQASVHEYTAAKIPQRQCPASRPIAISVAIQGK